MNKTRRKQMQIRMSDKEFLEAKKKIDRSKLNQNQYLLECVLDKEIIVLDGLGDLVYNLKKIGVNLNQIAKMLNSFRVINCQDELQQTQKELKKVWQTLNVLAQKVQ